MSKKKEKKLAVDDEGKLVMEFALEKPDPKKQKRDFKIKLFVHTIPVKYKSEKDFLEDCAGDIENDEEYIKGYWSPKTDPETIWILDTVNPNSTDYFILLLHELIKAINDKFGMELLQGQICTIGECYASILVENKKLFMDLLRNIK